MEVMKRNTIILAAALVVGLVGYAFWALVATDTGDSLRETIPRSAGDGGQKPQVADPEPDGEPQGAVRGTQPGESRRSGLHDVVASREPFPHDVRMDDYKATLWSEIQADPPKIMKRGDPALDGETAYRIYLYFGNCLMAPPTPYHVDRRLERIIEQTETTSARFLEGLESSADQIFDMYEFCLAIPPEVDRRMEAVLWMAEAARLGYEIAQVQFYEKAMGFLMRPDLYAAGPPLVMQHPELIEDFKATARFALRRSLEKGHPEAWQAMSQAVLDGVVFPKDPVLALAYARVAELEAMENRVILPRLKRQKSLVSQYLDPEQRAEAEELAARLRTANGG